MPTIRPIGEGHAWYECQPALVHLAGKPSEEDAARGRKALEVFNTFSDEHKKAFHQFCCFNSRDQMDLMLTNEIMDAIQKALSERPT